MVGASASSVILLRAVCLFCERFTVSHLCAICAFLTFMLILSKCVCCGEGRGEKRKTVPSPSVLCLMQVRKINFVCQVAVCFV